MPRSLVLALLVVGGCGDALLARPDDAGPIDAAVVDVADDARELDAIDARLDPPPVVIVLIGDGMGVGQVEAASLYRHGTRDGLAMQRLGATGAVRTGGPSGITDSAAAATVLATGVYTYNGAVGVDRYGVAVETLVERAARHGWATGVVTTTSLPHATPAGFTSHVSSRSALIEIADQMVRVTHPDVMLGGGSLYFAPVGDNSVRSDDGLYDDLELAGYRHVTTAAELADAVAAGAPRLFGDFAPDQLTYVSGRAPDTTEPMLIDTARAAIATLDRDPDGFFLMIEGGRIDHGSHANNLVDAVQETLAFDDTVAWVSAWARARGNVTILVTADHECGGLEVVSPRPAGTYPTVRWRWGNHTNARVPVYGDGPGAAIVDGAVIDHRWIHAIARARIEQQALVPPPREPVPDGELGELRHRAVTQTVATGFGAGKNQLDALWLDATRDGLYLGVEGLFEWNRNAVQIWIDIDPGAGTGFAGLADALDDADGVADRVLGASQVTAPAVAFGVDVALVSIGGGDPKLEESWDTAGLRALRQPGQLGWLRAAVNFGAVRAGATPMASVPGQGLEAFVPWTMLYPGGVVPIGARVRLAALLVSTTGEFTSNQFLPPLAVAAGNPGVTSTALPGVVEYVVDRDRDGVVDGDQPPTVLR